MNNTTNERYVLEHTNVEKSVKLGEVFEPQIRWSFDKKMEWFMKKTYYNDLLLEVEVKDGKKALNTNCRH